MFPFLRLPLPSQVTLGFAIGLANVKDVAAVVSSLNLPWQSVSQMPPAQRAPFLCPGAWWRSPTKCLPTGHSTLALEVVSAISPELMVIILPFDLFFLRFN